VVFSSGKCYVLVLCIYCFEKKLKKTKKNIKTKNTKKY